jgi:hypothetical protein
MDELEYQKQVMDELKFKDLMAEELRQAYIRGWYKGMEDSAEMLKEMEKSK